MKVQAPIVVPVECSEDLVHEHLRVLLGHHPAVERHHVGAGHLAARALSPEYADNVVSLGQPNVGIYTYNLRAYLNHFFISSSLYSVDLSRFIMSSRVNVNVFTAPK